MSTTTLYARVDQANYDWLKDQSAVSGVSIAAIVNAILSYARQADLVVAEQPRLIARPQ